MAMFHLTMARKHMCNEFIHISYFIYLYCRLLSLSRSSLHVSAHIAHNSKAQPNLKLILSLLYPHVTEAVDSIEEGSFLISRQA